MKFTTPGLLLWLKSKPSASAMTHYFKMHGNGKMAEGISKAITEAMAYAVKISRVRTK